MSKFDNEIEKGTNKLNSTIDDVKNTGKEAVSSLKDKAGEAKEYISDSLKDAPQNLKYRAADIKDKAIEVNEDLTGYVKNNPWKTIGLSIVTGLALGRLFNLKK